MEQRSNEFKFIDNDTIKQDWNKIKAWILSAESKKFRVTFFFLVILIFVSLGIPLIFQKADSILREFFDFIVLLLIIPAIMVILPIFSFIIINVMLSVLWIEEKDTVFRFQEFSKRQVSIFIRSRSIMPLLVALFFETSLFIVLLTYLSFYSENFMKLPLESLRTYDYLIGVVIFNVFSTLFITWNLISHGNYIKSLLPDFHEINAAEISDETFQKIKKMRRSYLDNTGFFLNQIIISFIGLLYFLPLSIIAILVLLNNFSTSLDSLISNFSSFLSFWILFLNIIFLFMSLVLIRKAPKKLQTIPRGKFLILEDIRRYSN